MKKIKKVISLLMAVVMAFVLGSVSVSASNNTNPVEYSKLSNDELALIKASEYTRDADGNFVFTLTKPAPSTGGLFSALRGNALTQQDMLVIAPLTDEAAAQIAELIEVFQITGNIRETSIGDSLFLRTRIYYELDQRNDGRFPYINIRSVTGLYTIRAYNAAYQSSSLFVGQSGHDYNQYYRPQTLNLSPTNPSPSYWDCPINFQYAVETAPEFYSAGTTYSVNFMIGNSQWGTVHTVTLVNNIYP